MTTSHQPLATSHRLADTSRSALA